MDKMDISWEEFKNLSADLARTISLSGFKPDYIVGINRGGIILSAMLSHYFDTPHYTLTVRLRSNPIDVDHNAWMPEDAYGDPLSQEPTGQKILIVDDINDSGATFEWIKKDWSGEIEEDKDLFWEKIWHNNVKFAVLIDNEASTQNVDFRAKAINKAEKDVWVDFPWETWWTK